MAPPTKLPKTSDRAASTQAENTTVISEIRLNGWGSKVPSSVRWRNLFKSAGSREILWPHLPGREEGWHLGLAAPPFSGSLPSSTLSCQRKEAFDMPPFSCWALNCPHTPFHFTPTGYSLQLLLLWTTCPPNFSNATIREPNSFPDENIFKWVPDASDFYISWGLFSI